MKTDDCPSDADLWPIATGEPVEVSLTSHVALCNRCSRRVETLRADLHSLRAAGAFCEAPGVAATDLPNLIGEYEILSLLGNGGQADVYRAWHPRLKIDVVIKWYRVQIRGTEQSEWQAAASALCTVNHPHLGRLYDIGVDQGRPYQVIEFVRGRTLCEWIRTIRPNLLRMMIVLTQIAQAVEAVHRHGALHLDLKPENILIDELGNAHVIDFGMARVTNGRLQSLMMPPGTLEYMSPEQCVGDGERIGTASDVYGLGAVLFSMLTGQPPRTEERMKLEPDWKLLRRFPVRLARICRKAMSTDVLLRQKSAVGFAKDLEQFVELQHWTGRGVSTVVSVIGCFGLLLGVAATPASDPAPSFEVSGRPRVFTSGDIHWNTTIKSEMSYVPQWFLTTSQKSPVQITENVTTRPPESAYEPRCTSTLSLGFPEGAGPTLVVAGKPSFLAVNCSRKIQELDLALKSWTVVHITAEGIQSHRLLGMIADSERARVTRILEHIRGQLSDQHSEYFAALIIPPSAYATMPQ